MSQMRKLRRDERMFIRDVLRCRVSGLQLVLGIENDVLYGFVAEARGAQSSESGLESPV